MSDAAQTPSREEEMLARLAELDLAAAEKAHAKLMAADEPADIAELGRTYQRMARSLRQTLALKAKLARERASEAATRPRPPPEPPLFHTGLKIVTPAERAHIEAAADTVLRWAERERPDWDDLDQTEVYDILLDMASDEAFLDTPVDVLLDTVRECMDLPPFDPEDAPPDAAASPPPAHPDTG